MSIDDLLDKFNWIERIDGLLFAVHSFSLRRRSHKGRKVGCWRIDPGVKRIEIDRRSHSGAEAERALRRAHIEVRGRGVNGKCAYFYVYTRQYRWALYILLREGVVIRNTVPADVARWAGQHTGPVALWGADRRAANGAKASAHPNKCRGSVRRKPSGS